jgi:hypothetical protein
MAKNKGLITFIAILVIAVGLMIWGTGGGEAKSNFTPDGEVTCVNPNLPVPNDLHLHPELEIFLEGEKIAVPANMGLSSDCHKALHTHDELGVIHIEPNHPGDFTLKNFFEVWGQPFSQNQILGKYAGASHEIIMTVDGARNYEYENLILKDKQKIKIEYVAK